AVVQQQYDQRNGGGYLKRVDTMSSWVDGNKQDVEKLKELDDKVQGRTTGYRLFSPTGAVVRNFAADERVQAEQALAARSHGDQLLPLYQGPKNVRTNRHPVIGQGGEKYASIVEIVTKAYEPETPQGFVDIVTAMDDAAKFAAALEAKTGNF